MDPTAFFGILAGYMVFRLASTLRPVLQPVLIRVMSRFK